MNRNDWEAIEVGDILWRPPLRYALAEGTWGPLRPVTKRGPNSIRVGFSTYTWANHRNDLYRSRREALLVAQDRNLRDLEHAKKALAEATAERDRIIEALREEGEGATVEDS